MVGEKSAKKGYYSEPIDRCSELPEPILQIILSFLDPKEACCASTLSKQWYEAWSSLPVLDFQFNYFYKSNVAHSRNEETFQRFLGFIDKTMKRYSENKYPIKKFKLEFRNFEEKLKPLVDEWVRIAVERRVQEFDIDIYGEEKSSYTLPETLFRSKYLKSLRCSWVELPYYKELDLILLENLRLLLVTVDENMLQRILSFCPLIDLQIESCYNLKSLSIPWMTTKVQSRTMQQHSDIKTSSLLKTFSYSDDNMYLWPWKMNLGALRNLRELVIHQVNIMDDDVSQLVSGLVALESLRLVMCDELNHVKIESVSLKKLDIIECYGMMEVTIDAPKLRRFLLDAELKPKVSIVNSDELCVGHFLVCVDIPSAEWLIKLKKFLVETNIFKFLYVQVHDCYGNKEIEINMDELKNMIDNGEKACKVREITLYESYEWKFTKASLSSFVDGLLWCCRPDMLILPTKFKNQTYTEVYRILKPKAKIGLFWKYGLKKVKMEVVDVADMKVRWINYADEAKIRLFW